MLQTELLPVTVYRSADDGAPQLTANQGSLKTILKACLTDGYGSKSSLGWSLQFEDAHRAVFKRNDVKATEATLQIVNSNSRSAILKMARQPTAVDAADGFITLGDGCVPYIRQGISSAIPWVLVGHGRAFCFIFKSSYYDIACRFFWYGDFPSLATADSGNTLLYLGASGSVSQANGIYNSAPFPAIVSSGSSGVSPVFYKSASQIEYGSIGAINSLCAVMAPRTYPDLIFGGLDASEIWLHEKTSPNLGYNLYPRRGLWPGLYYCGHDVSSIPDLGEIAGFDGTSDRFIKFNHCDASNNEVAYRHGLLVNITAWPA